MALLFHMVFRRYLPAFSSIWGKKQRGKSNTIHSSGDKVKRLYQRTMGLWTGALVIRNTSENHAAVPDRLSSGCERCERADNERRW
jgi:hypothetical protein